MAQLIKREKAVPRSAGTWDPFRAMRNWMAWDPFRELATLKEGPLADFVPDFEIKETKEGYVFKGDLPGIKEKDLDISVSGNLLSISGKRDEEHKEEGDKFYTYERSYGSFTRSFTMPDGADLANVHADLSDGVLTIAVPKKGDVKPKKIKVKKGEKH